MELQRLRLSARKGARLCVCSGRRRVRACVHMRMCHVCRHAPMGDSAHLDGKVKHH